MNPNIIIYEFPKLDDVLLLNSGTLSRTPRSVFEAQQRYETEYEKNPTKNLFNTWPRLWDVQKKLAKFFNANPHDIFFRHNVTLALNELILGIKLEPGGEILSTDLEYGAITNLCKRKAIDENRKFRSINLSQVPEDSIVEHIVSQLDRNSRLLLISQVCTSTGLIVPIEKLGEECRKRNIFMVVDGAHAAGSICLDFSKFTMVDAYAANLHKWMMGPKGTGFGWIHPMHREKIKPVQGGWTSFDIPKSFQGFGDGNLKTTELLMASCHNFAPFFAIEDLLLFWNKIGTDTIATHIKDRQNYLEIQMNKHLSWSSLSPKSHELRGPLLSYKLPEGLSRRAYEWMWELLNEHRLQVIVAPYQDSFVLRLSPHIYTCNDEIDTAVLILKKYA